MAKVYTHPNGMDKYIKTEKCKLRELEEMNDFMFLSGKVFWRVLYISCYNTRSDYVFIEGEKQSHGINLNDYKDNELTTLLGDQIVQKIEWVK